MKFLKQICFSSFIVLASIAFISCQSENQTNQQAQASNEKTDESSKTGTSISAVLDQYILLKDALVETDAAAGKTNAESLLSAIESSSSKIDDQGLKGQLNSLKTSTQSLASSEDVEAQRVAFEQVTADMLEIVRAHKPGDQTLYYQYCPMAFGNKGAYWISNEKKIMNPYFGDKMLHCGKVAEEL